MSVGYNYPGVLAPIRCVFTDTLGLWPGVFLMDFAPQIHLPDIVGTLALFDGNGGFVSIPNCKIDSASISVTTNGHIEHCRGLDPRWTWEFGEVEGAYNIRASDGSIIDGTERSPRELAAILFEAMGVPLYDVSALPDSSRPYVNWQGVPPRPHLQWLLDSLGCTVAMNWATGAAVVVRLGQGSPVPDGAVTTLSFGVDLSEAPSRIKVRCGRDLHQTKFKLKMHLLDVDGSWKPYDEVSYAPEGGWNVTDASDPLPEGEEPALSLAKRWFGRVYRIDTAADGTLTIPGREIPIEYIEQCLPLQEGLLETYTLPNGSLEAMPPKLEGTYWLGDVIDDEIDAAENSNPFSPLSADFSVDTERGLVFLRKRTLKLSDDRQKFEPADLYLTISHPVWDGRTGGLNAFSVERQISQFNTGALVEHADYLSRKYVGHYEKETLLYVTDNEAYLQATLDGLIDSLAASYYPVSATAVSYAAIVPLPLDGRRRQCTYSVHYKDGATTRVYLNSEGEVGVPRLREMRRIARLLRIRNVPRMKRGEDYAP